VLCHSLTTPPLPHLDGVVAGAQGFCHTCHAGCCSAHHVRFCRALCCFRGAGGGRCGAWQRCPPPFVLRLNMCGRVCKCMCKCVQVHVYMCVGMCASACVCVSGCICVVLTAAGAIAGQLLLPAWSQFRPRCMVCSGQQTVVNCVATVASAVEPTCCSEVYYLFFARGYLLCCDGYLIVLVPCLRLLLA
jgi:hypothetical protein